jgi:hypothetical protein
MFQTFYSPLDPLWVSGNQNTAIGELVFLKSIVTSVTALEYRRQVEQASLIEIHRTLLAHPFEISLLLSHFRIEALVGESFCRLFMGSTFGMSRSVWRFHFGD